MKVFRDPIHNIIDLDMGCVHTNALILDIIDSDIFQRLRYIRQLGFAYFAYPSANHTRFEHSLGVAHLAKVFIERLLMMEDEVLSRQQEYRGKLADFFAQLRATRTAAIIAALLHDAGHGFLSHVAEYTVEIDHEKCTREILLEDTEVNRLLQTYSPDLPQMVCGILTSHAQPAHRLISGILDIDKIDYLLRDSHMTGSKYGEFDLGWLVNVLDVGIARGEVCIGLKLGKGLSIAEDFVLARHYMRRNVYSHKIAFVAEEMLQLLIRRVREHGTELFKPYDSMSEFVFSGVLPKDDFCNITDVEFFYFLRSLQSSHDPVLARLADGLINRKLYKEVPSTHMPRVEEYLMRTYGADGEFYMCRCTWQPLRYFPDDAQLFLFDKSGAACEIREASDVLDQSSKTTRPKHACFVDAKMYEEFLRQIQLDPATIHNPNV